MRKSILLFFILLANFADASTYLLHLSNRPTIAEVREEADSLQIPYSKLVQGHRFNLDYFRKSLEADAPGFIARLEKTYPDAKFVFLGRDTQLIADVVDAFYISIGQKDRVQQLGVSTPTLAGLNDDLVMNYLEQYGITIENLKKSKRPIVLVDTISKGDNSSGVLVAGRQGRHILQVVYKKWIKSGNSAADLLRKFNLIGMQVSTFRKGEPDNNYRFKDALYISTIHEENAYRIKNSYSTETIGRDMQVALIPDTPNLFNESGYDHFTATWHDKFQPPQSQNGKLVQTPGPLMPENYRWSVLWMQTEVIRFVFNPTFTDRVIEAGRQLGVTFKKANSGSDDELQKIANEKELIRKLKDFKMNEPVLGEKYTYDKKTVNNQTLKLTTNGEKLISIVLDPASISSPNYFEIILNSMVELHGMNKIGKRDLMRIFLMALSQKKVEGDQLSQLVQNKIYTSVALQELFGDTKYHSAVAIQGGYQKTNYEAIMYSITLPPACKHLLGQ